MGAWRQHKSLIINKTMDIVKIITEIVLPLITGCSIGYVWVLSGTVKRQVADIQYERKMKESALNEVAILRHIMSILAPEHLPKETEPEVQGDDWQV